MWRKFSLTQYIVWKGRSIFNSLLKYSSLMLYQNAASDSFLKDFLQCGIWKFAGKLSNSLTMLKSIGLTWALNGSFTAFDSVTDALVIWKMLVYWALQTFLILACYLEYLLVPSPISSEVFKYYRAVKFMVADTGFSLFWFSLESSNFIINHKFCQLFF